MNPSKDKAEEISAGHDKADESFSAADAKQASQIISAFNLVKMNLSIYPAGHSQIDESVDYAYHIIQNILARTPNKNRRSWRNAYDG